MKTIYLDKDTIQEHHSTEQSVLALGNFDGLHLGHSAVIDKAKQIADRKKLSLAVMSFSPHPKTVLGKDTQAFNHLMPIKEKERRLAMMGVDLFYIVEFNRAFARLSPESFEADYLLHLGAKAVVAGFDYAYGYKGEGNLASLKQRQSGLEVIEVDKVEWDGEKISSTLIRQCLHQGNVAKMKTLLGESYQTECERVNGSVVVKPYYTLPTPGRYHIRLIQGEKSYIDVATVCREGHVTLEAGKPNFVPNQESLFIEWNEQVQLIRN